ncbi:hypothetical protein EDD85DRAFT_956907 [Armillaria nabsnona]|nr:hypothetical protein EDD85DRAFT_956907 [Armillaria nabsnona]
MPLSHIPQVDIDHMKTLLTEMASAIDDIRHLKSTLVDAKQQLQTYKDESAIDGCFRVDTKRSDEYNYLMWSDTDKEVILQVEGVLLEGCVPPVVRSGSENSPRLNDLVQSILIGGRADDCEFNDAVAAIEAIHYFMSRFDQKPSTYYHTRIDDMDAIHVETRLFTPTQWARSGILDHHVVDQNDVLRDVLRRGTHHYTEDNTVAFLKWDKGTDGSISVSDMNPTMLRPGHLVDIGICFHMLKLNNRIRFLVRLDSVVVMNRIGAEILKVIKKHSNEDQDVIARPVKKRRVHFKGTNISVHVQSSTDIDTISDMLFHAST